MLTLQANFIEEISGLDELIGLEQLYFQQNKIKKISGLQNLKKLEILDLACNELEEISSLEGQAESLEELWVNNNLVTKWTDLEYLGSTMKKLDNFYIACNPIHERGEEFKVKVKATVPSLTQLEGSPFDRPTYYFA
jgi:Leucine-rich repeat (LRR) protein